MTPTFTPNKRRQREAARSIALLGGARSAEARALVDHVVDDYVLPARLAGLPADKRKSLGPSGLGKRHKVVSALFADLLELHAVTKAGVEPAAGMHGVSPKDFCARTLGFARSIFLEVTGHMEAAGLLQVTKGAPRWHPVFDTFIVRSGDLTTYRLTPQALALIEGRGVPIADWFTHWRLKDTLPTQIEAEPFPLMLRSTRKRVRGKKGDTVNLPVDRADHEAGHILGGVRALNGYLANQIVGNIAFSGLRRIFNNGDELGFRWNKGGRYYSLPGGHSYEIRSSEWRRSVITINSEPVDEVDLRASHLTLLHALLRQPFDPRQDPYKVADLPRAVTKAWVSQAIGASNPRPSRWSQRAQAEYEAERPGQWLQDGFAIQEVGAAVKGRHPFLIELKSCGIGPLDLMFHEAEILRLAMEDLMLTQNIPVLPMHDALIAPRSALGMAQAALERAFVVHVESVTGNPSSVRPMVTCKGLKP